MSIIESVVVSAFGLAMVFFVLACLCLIVMALTKVLHEMAKKQAVSSPEEVKSETVNVSASEKDENGFSTGELKLINVDERTAAMIMAIVSHESKIPLSELCFKSIKAID